MQPMFDRPSATTPLRGGDRRASAGLAVSALLLLGASSPRAPASPGGQDPVVSTQPSTLEETRLVMGKWIETQQILSRERNEWQQGKEILLSRLELVKREISGLEEKLKEAREGVAQTQAKRDELLAQNEQLAATGAQLGASVTGMEGEVVRLFRSLPEPLQTKLQPLRQRVPEDAANTRVSVAERFQNVLGILNEVNQANNELAVHYEVRTLADGRLSEVQALYVGLAQAYYVCPNGEAGIGRPTADGWQWEASRSVASRVLMALEIAQGKQSPAFVPLPVRFP
jgi:uncharacterized protein DUF3450